MKLVLPRSVQRSLDSLYMHVFGGIALAGDPWTQDHLAEKSLEYQTRVIALCSDGISPGHADAWKLWDSLCKQGVAEDVLARGRTRRGLARKRCLSLVEKVLVESGTTSPASEILDLPHPIRSHPPRTMFENAYWVVQQYVKNRDRFGVYGGTGF